MEEIWKDIEGYEGFYQVSTLGNVRSMNYRRTGVVKNIIPKVNNCGRLWVDLKGKPMLIHRLVAIAFIRNKNNLPEINHKDGNPKNNNVNNLEWCTGEYNKKEYAMARKHKESKPRKLFNKVNQIDSCGRVVRQWDNPLQIKKETGMNQWSITMCCEGARKTAYGFRWQYAI